MYNFMLIIHNWLRWIVLILGIVAAVLAFLGWFGRRPWTNQERRFGSFFGMAIDIQLLLGLILYFVLSPITTAALKNFGAAMSNPDMRFFGLEHVLYMVLALACAHLGSILSRRAPSDTAKYQRAAVFFGLAVVFILLGMPWMRPLLRV